jgi:MFS transporter, DHA1 family, inner membrane transport protein
MNPALVSLFLAAFSIGTTAFVIAGLLPAIAADLGVSIPAAGLLVTGYALGVAVGGPALSLLTSRFPRKLSILGLMAIFVIGQAFCATATTYPLLMAARLFVSLTHGSFFGLAVILAVTIVPPNARGGAIALVFSGLTISNVVGVPLGTAIGAEWGWRATFWTVGAVAVVASIAMALLLPNDAAVPRAHSRLADQFRVLRHQKVLTSYAMIFLMMLGNFAVFTYVTPLLTETAGIAPGYVPWILLVFGIGSTIGIFAGGRLADRAPKQTLLFGFIMQFVVFGAIVAFDRDPVILPVVLFFQGFGVFVVNAGLQNRVLQGAAAAPDLASTLISSVFNLGIAVGASLGALLLTQGADYGELPIVGCVTAALATLIAFASARLDAREATALC